MNYSSIKTKAIYPVDEMNLKASHKSTKSQTVTTTTNTFLIATYACKD